jgi:hypothetical protein
MLNRPQKITLAEMRTAGVRELLMCCSDYRGSHWTASANDWPDEVGVSDLEAEFTCQACGRRSADGRRAGSQMTHSGTRRPDFGIGIKAYESERGPVAASVRTHNRRPRAREFVAARHGITPDPLMTPYSEFLGTLALAGHEPALVIRDIVERAAARSGATFDL